MLPNELIGKTLVFNYGGKGTGFSVEVRGIVDDVFVYCFPTSHGFRIYATDDIANIQAGIKNKNITIGECSRETGG